jgi:preprotein translocase subunit Sss1
LNVQVSSIGLYLAGLIGFAVLLALVEQSVLQVR